MNWLLIQVLLLQLILPLALLVWLAKAGEHSRLVWLLKTIIVVSYLTSLAVAGIWLVVPWYVPHFYLAASLLLAIRAGLHVRSRSWLDSRGLLSLSGFTGLLLISIVAIAGTAYLFTGWIPHSTAHINLAFPLQQGTYYVVHGGSNALLNPHLKTLTPIRRYLPWRGQSYGIDLVKINHWGLRADGVQPTDPERYEIFGDRVISPCAGKVVYTENDRPDMLVPVTDPDRNQLAGNHVLLECRGIELLLAHLQHGSVAVKAGDEVAVGDYLGLVGNSGNSTEPHLHISAQLRTPAQPLIGGEPVVIFFDSKYLVRNQRMRVIHSEHRTEHSTSR